MSCILRRGWLLLSMLIVIPGCVNGVGWLPDSSGIVLAFIEVIKSHGVSIRQKARGREVFEETNAPTPPATAITARSSAHPRINEEFERLFG